VLLSSGSGINNGEQATYVWPGLNGSETYEWKVDIQSDSLGARSSSIWDFLTSFKCSLDSECGFCEKCGVEDCVLQNTSEDVKDECAASSSCLNAFSYDLATGYCDGAGTCDAYSSNVSEGNVCINSSNYDTNPTSGVYCSIWSDCVQYEISANEYYVGYLGDGTENCSSSDWQSAGTVQLASFGTRFANNEQIDSCSLENIGLNFSSVSCPSKTPVENSTVDFIISGQMDASPSFTYIGNATIYLNDVEHSANCSINLTGEFECVVTFQYYDAPGTYDVLVVMSGVNQNASDLSSTTYNELLASYWSSDEVVFTSSYIGYNNISVDIPISITNLGNANITSAKLIAHDLTGVIIPSKKLLASYFRAGSELSNSVQLADGIEKNIPFVLSPSETVDFSLWLSAPSDTYPQTYVSATAWQLVLE
jgi:hypothetical protein